MKRVRELVASDRFAEWVGWPIWTIVCFVASLVVGGVVVLVFELAGYHASVSTTLGSMVLSSLIYAVMVALLISIGRIKTQVNLPTAVSAIGGLVLTGIAVLYALDMVGFGVFALLLVVSGAAFVIMRIPKKHRVVTKKQLGIHRTLSWEDLGLGAAGYVVYFVIFIALSLLLTYLVPAYDSGQNQDIGFTALFGTERLIGFIVLVVITPIVEELIMRGFLFGKLRSARMPFWPAAVAVSVLFAAAHGQWNVGVDTFVLSMVACYLREMTGTIWPGVIIHMAKNALAYVLLFVFVIK